MCTVWVRIPWEPRRLRPNKETPSDSRVAHWGVAQRLSNWLLTSGEILCRFESCRPSILFYSVAERDASGIPKCRKVVLRKKRYMSCLERGLTEWNSHSQKKTEKFIGRW